jgi:hypothetical protein
MIASTAFVTALMRPTAFLAELGTQTEPKATAMSVGSLPTGIRVTRSVSASIR